jgi:predicted  nucleic acid-binding Zn-ribbon protein
VQAEGDLQALQSTVDSVASFENMIEKLSGNSHGRIWCCTVFRNNLSLTLCLTEENLDLAERLREAQEAVRDLEDAAELTEEIDQQQRRQMEVDRSTIDMLTVAVSTAEQRLVERDRALAEQEAAAKKVKAANNTLKAEIARLNAQLSSGSQESQQLEAKLRELAYLRSNQEVLAAELHTVSQAQVAAVAQKYKFQALYSRMEAIFGGTAVFIEESKQISTEIAVVSAASAGMEACRGLSAVLDEVLQAQQSSAEGTDGLHVTLDWDALALGGEEGGGSPSQQAVRVVPLLGGLHALLLQAEAYAVQSCLDHFRPSAPGEKTLGLPPRVLQRLIDLKARFEGISHLSGRVRTAVAAVAAEWRSHVSAAAGSLAVAAAAAAGGEGGDQLDASFSSVAGSAGSGAVDFVPSEAHAVLVRQLLTDLAAAAKDFLLHMTATLEGSDLLNVLQNCTLLEASSSGSVNPVLRLELLYVSMNTLCDVSTHQLERSAPGTASEEHLLLALRSMKSDLKTSILNFKANTAHFVEKLPDIQGNFQLFVSCFAQLQEAGLVLNSSVQATEGVVKMVQNFLRKLNSGSSMQGASSATQQLMLGTSGVMRFYPFAVLSNTVPVGDTALRGQLREQFEQHASRYWMLAIHTNSDLLLPVQSSQAPSSAGSGGSSTYTEVSWRQRVADARSLIAETLGSVSLPAKDTGAGSAEASVVPSPTKAAASAAMAGKLQALANELEVKRDELRAAMERCDDLQAQLDNAHAAAASQPAASAHTGKSRAGAKKRTGAPKEVPELLEEIATLEEALFATEQRVEALEQEGRTLKAQAAQAAAAAPGGGSQAKEVAGSAGPVSWDLKQLAKKRPVVSPAGNAISTAQFQVVLAQSNHWRGLALKRLTASLLPLPSVPLHPTLTSSSSKLPGAEAAAQPKDSAGPVQTKLTFKHVELVAGAADCAALYHQLRMARASGARIRDCSSELSGEGWSKVAAVQRREERRVKSSLMYRIKF